MITFINTKDTYKIRLELLRPGKPLQEVQFPNDNLAGSFHLGKFINNKLIGIVSYSPRNIEENFTHFSLSNPNQKTENIQYQLRGMAVLTEHQNKGYGYELCDFAERTLSVIGCNFLWCNARTSALEFYKKQGFKMVSKEFPILDAGPHYIMQKELS